MTAAEWGEEVQRALDVARQLARDGIPVFIAPPSTEEKDKSGFKLPWGWENTPADPAVAGSWQPGWAMCAVMGHGLDLVDLDLYAAPGCGEAMAPVMPAHYGVAATVSGGMHFFVRSIGQRSRNALLPGVDIKSGTADGKGRGFAFIAPTIRMSKATGRPGGYRWIAEPDARRAREAAGDKSGRLLSELIERVRRGEPVVPGAAPAPGDKVAQFYRQERPRAWGDYDPQTRRHAGDLTALLQREGRNTGVMRLAAALRAQGGWQLADAIGYMYEHVWPLIDQGQGSHGFSEAEFEAVIRAQWRQYPDGIQQSLQAAAVNASSGTWPVPGGALELTDTYLKDVVEEWGIRGRFLWARGIGWLCWTQLVWKPVDNGVVVNAVSDFMRAWHAYCATNGAAPEVLAKMASLLSAARVKALTDLVHGHPMVIREAEDFDAYPDFINTPDGIIDLRSGEKFGNDPRWMFTKCTSGRYIPGFRHKDWEAALTALDEEERAWYKRRIGQAVTGHPPADGIMPVLQGSGMNGKTALTTDGPVRALGDFADMASHKLITALKPGVSEHSTEMADLRGQRLLIGEELAEGRSLDVTALKRIMDVGRIKARYVHRDNITFTASHSLFVTTNYVPVINETDHGTWRRLALLRFRYTYRKTAAQCARPADRLADDGLKHRIRQNESGQHDAIVTWAVEGAIDWYAEGNREMPMTDRITADTAEWRTAADRILGFCTEMLEPDSGACVRTTDMLDQFNAWIARNGHNAWPKETFTPRFAAHEWVTRHNIEYLKTARLSGLVRWPVIGVYSPETGGPKRSHVWQGVRPRTQDDQAESAEVSEVSEVTANLSWFSRIGEFAVTSDTTDTGLNVAPGVTPDSPPVPENPESSQPVITISPPPFPPKPKNPKTPQQLQREADRKAAKALEREQARLAKIAELGGALVPLPAIVTRNLQVISCTPDDAAAFLNPFLPALAVDVEHSGYPVGHDDHVLRLVQLGGEAGAAVLDPADRLQAGVIRYALKHAKVLHAHSALADLVPLEHAGLCDRSAWDKMTDTVILAKLTDPKLTDSDEAALKPLARALLGEDAALSWRCDKARAGLFAAGGWLTETELLTPLQRSGWAQVPLCETFVRYAASDVMDCAAVARVLR